MTVSDPADFYSPESYVSAEKDLSPQTPDPYPGLDPEEGAEGVAGLEGETSAQSRDADAPEGEGEDANAPHRQMVLKLPVRAALGREAFFVSPANAAAVGMISGGAAWPSGKLALTGPESAGKTHLVHVWAAETDAVIVSAARLGQLDIPTLASARNIAVEDVPRIAGDRRTESALFHLHNLTLAEGGRLLFTGRTAPSRWALGLADLASRMQATTTVTLDLPDDALLAAILRKHFSDRQLQVPENVTSYLTARMTRSGASAGRLAERLDRLSLAEQRRVTVPLARLALTSLDMDPGEAP